MNAPHTRQTDGGRDTSSRKRWGGGPGIAVLASTALIVTYVSVVLWRYDRIQDTVLAGYALGVFLGLVVVTSIGSITLAISERNPWWLLPTLLCIAAPFATAFLLVWLGWIELP